MTEAPFVTLSYINIMQGPRIMHEAYGCPSNLVQPAKKKSKPIRSQARKAESHSALHLIQKAVKDALMTTACRSNESNPAEAEHSFSAEINASFAAVQSRHDIATAIFDCVFVCLFVP